MTEPGERSLRERLEAVTTYLDQQGCMALEVCDAERVAREWHEAEVAAKLRALLAEVERTREERDSARAELFKAKASLATMSDFLAEAIRRSRMPTPNALSVAAVPAREEDTSAVNPG